MKAIILAAGRGSRMHEATKDVPKCMMKVCGKTLLERCLDTLKQSGFEKKDISIVTGYKREVIEDVVEGITFFHNDDWNNTNMVYSLTKADSWLCEEDCCVFYSDIIFSPAVVKRIVAVDDNIVIPYYTEYLELWKKRFTNPLDDLETFVMDGENKLIEIGSKPTSFDQINGQYMGIVKFTPCGWKDFINSIKSAKRTIQSVDMTSLLSATITAGHKIVCVDCSELWLECDNMNDVRLYESLYGRSL